MMLFTNKSQSNYQAKYKNWDGEKLYPPKANALSKVWKLGGLWKVNGILVKTHRQESLIHSVFIIN